MDTIGRHLIVEFYECNNDTLNDLDVIREGMKGATLAIGATVVGETFHHFAPQGVSGTIVIAESHLSIHTWPESGYCSVDIYTCGGLNPHPGYEFLAKVIDASSWRLQEIVRGLPEDLEEGQQIRPGDIAIMAKNPQIFKTPASTLA